MRAIDFYQTSAGALIDMFQTGVGTAGFVAYADMSIMSIKLSCAAAVVPVYFRLDRSGHPSSPIYLTPLADPAAEGDNTWDFYEMFGSGIELKVNEVAHLWVMSGAGVLSATMTVAEPGDAVPTMNMRAIRVAGSAAAVADAITISDGNIVLPANVAYTVLGVLLESTTPYYCVVRKDGKDVASVRAITAPELGHTADTFMFSVPVRKVLTGTNQDIHFAIKASAADAAAVQFYTPFLLLPTGL